MTKIDIISGFLGAGKTTLIKKLLKEELKNEKTVLIENEFGEIGIDSGFLKDSGIEIKEMNQGCICCSLVGDFGTSLKEVLKVYNPERIIIEPSGVGKLSDVIKAVEGVMKSTDSKINSSVVVVDATRCKMYIKNFGEFYLNQISNASTIVLSRTDKMDQVKLERCVEMIREYNQFASIITTPWDKLESKLIIDTIENGRDLNSQLLQEVEEEYSHHEEGCCCGGHDHDHHYNHGETCGCGGHDHDHHHGHNHGHHADEVFTSWGKETTKIYTKEQIKEILLKLEEEKEFGMVLRAKGMVPSKEEPWIYFDYVPGEIEVRDGKADTIGKLCVIGSKLNEDKLSKLFFGK